MTEARPVRRVELVVGVLALTAAAGAVIGTLHAARFHAAQATAAIESLSLGSLRTEGTAVLVLSLLSLAVVARACRSALRQVRGQRAYIRRLRAVGTACVDGREVTVVRGTAARAFCAGWLRPRIFVTQGTLRRLGREELRAVVAHEAHHADRRDPLRLLIGTAIASSLRAIPSVRALGRRQADLADVAADAAAVRRLGDRRPVAGALLAFDEREGGVVPERVDHLLGEGTPQSVPAALLAVACAAVLALVGVALLVAFLPAHATLPGA